ncbi:ABC transporter substrate-binding protein [Phreatobacter sp. AB_2022a]|uniref:ABC transporter substrate-binding protein n=1 Tax=Phreatobacter sp. AB_2022a TaxID=3003134 RepID=UPI002287298C|nr:ABC transporter substrate-binding protein [Phreatobacter sp. AB_2022a]MCZ0737951.1 ABC transporter substrate-binding protein [Phreatobacter sp. AB_2022a]
MRAIAACLVLAFGVSAALGAEPPAIVDALGRQVALPRPPERLVTIFASNTELVAAVGLADRIVGIESFTRFPSEVLDRPVVGGRLGFSVDRVVRQRPDLVVVTPARQAVHQLVDPMERLGIPIAVLTHRTIPEVLSNIRLVAAATGMPARGEAVAAGLERRLAAVADRIAGRSRPRVVMITGQVASGLLLVARPGSYTADAMVAAGGALAFDRPQMLAQVAPEALLRADPDIVLFAGSAADMHELFARRGWASLRALAEKRVFAVPRAEFLIPGPRVVDGVEKLATLLHPGAGP